MAIKLNGISSRIVLYYLTLTSFLFPTLFFALSFAIENQATNSFVSSVRASARNIADSLEAGQINDTVVMQILDTALLNSEGVFAEYARSGAVHQSLLNLELEGQLEDFEFGSNGDEIYFVHTTINELSGSQGVLIVGYDEEPTKAALIEMRNFLILLLSGAAAASLLLLVLFARRISKPLAVLQHRSQSVIAGRAVKLATNSGIYEIDQMSKNLEGMRSQLEGTNEQLLAQIEQRAKAEQAAIKLEEQLRQARKLEAIGTLAGGVAHEFNNLLLPMRLNIELAQQDVPADAAVRSNLKSVLQSIARADDIVNQILRFSYHHSINESTNIGADIAEVIRFQKATIPSGITVTHALGNRELNVSIGSSHAYQIVTNLLKNALTALEDQEKGCVHIALSEDETLKGFAQLTVRDNGAGMSDDVRKRAIDPFFTTRAVGQGTGLGLSVVQGIVTGGGGQLEIDSVINKGTIVRIVLPISEGKK